MACLLNRWLRNFNLGPLFVQKRTKSKFSIFDKNHGLTPFKKISVWQLFKITKFGLEGACFPTRRSLNIFSGPFCPKAKRKFPNFDENLTLWKNFNNYGNYLKLIFLWSRRACVLLDDHQTLFLGLICPNAKKWKISNFGPNSWPLKNTNVATMWNEYFYSLGRLFCAKWSSNIISRPILSRNKQREHFNFLTFEENHYETMCKINIFFLVLNGLSNIISRPILLKLNRGNL